MNFAKIEKAFIRALYFSFSKRRLMITFSTLVLWGFLAIFFRTLPFKGNPCISLALEFLPFFLVGGIFLGIGVILSQMYLKEVGNRPLNLKNLIRSSIGLIIGISYLGMVPLLIYLSLWIVLGLFFLLTEIPGIGPFFRIVFSFTPFLLILGSLLLSFLNLAILFFIPPGINSGSIRTGAWLQKVFSPFKERILRALILFGMGVFPLLFTFFLLLQAARLTNLSFSIAGGSFPVGIEWFFIMIPFGALLSPSVLFFFNFSSESYFLLQEKE